MKKYFLVILWIPFILHAKNTSGPTYNFNFYNGNGAAVMQVPNESPGEKTRDLSVQVKEDISKGKVEKIDTRPNSSKWNFGIFFETDTFGKYHASNDSEFQVRRHGKSLLVGSVGYSGFNALFGMGIQKHQTYALGFKVDGKIEGSLVGLEYNPQIQSGSFGYLLGYSYSKFSGAASFLEKIDVGELSMTVRSIYAGLKFRLQAIEIASKVSRNMMSASLNSDSEIYSIDYNFGSVGLDNEVEDYSVDLRLTYNI